LCNPRPAGGAGRSAGGRPSAASRGPGPPPSSGGDPAGGAGPPVHTPPPLFPGWAWPPRRRAHKFLRLTVLVAARIAWGRPSVPADRACDLADARPTALGRPHLFFASPARSTAIPGAPRPRCRGRRVKPSTGRSAGWHAVAPLVGLATSPIVSLRFWASPKKSCGLTCRTRGHVILWALVDRFAVGGEIQLQLEVVA
jgi:hypothetical protein